MAIKDLRTGRGVLIDPDADYPAASLFKLPVMYEVFKQRELGALSLDEVAYFTERQVDFDLGTLDRPAGAPITLREALERMVTISDNSSAILLTDRVGAFNINQDMADLGFSHTRLDAVNLTTSPQDMLNFFEMIARGQAVNPRTSLDMLELMGRQQVNDRIPRLLRRGTSVAHKTGNLPGIVNDVGIVSTADVSFAIAVMVNGTSEEGIAALTIAQIAADSLDYFESVQVPTPTPTVQATDTPVSTPTIEPSPSPVSTPVPSPTPARSSTPASVSPTRGTVIPTTTPRVTPTRAALS
ncbi:MAG TPA: serine hydrolase [Chloroflexota bacterium]